MPPKPDGPRDIIHTPGIKEDFHGKDFYQVLGVSKEAPPEEIIRAYKKRAQELHPDKHPGEEAYYEELFKALLEAYTVLSDEKKRVLYDFRDIFQARETQPAYYHEATSEQLDREYYNRNIIWLMELYRKERQEIRKNINSEARNVAYEIARKFPTRFKYKDAGDWSYDQIDWGKLAQPDLPGGEIPEYPKGEKTPEDLFREVFEKFGVKYRESLRNIKNHFRARAQHYAELYHQKKPKDPRARKPESPYSKEFSLNKLLIRRKDDDLFYIVVAGEELPEHYKELVWEDSYLLGENEQGQKCLIDMDTGQRLGEFHKNLKAEKSSGEILIIAKDDEGECLMNRNSGKAITGFYGYISVMEDEIYAYKDKEGMVLLKSDGQGGYVEEVYK